MQRSESSANDICTQPVKDMKDAEKIFTSALLPPIYLVAGYLVALRFMANDLKKQENEDEPFKGVWWSGPIFFTIAYLLMVYFGPKLMKDRPEFKIKPYIFTYNLYQCILNIWCVAAMIYEVYSNPIFPNAWGNVFVPGAPSFRISFLVCGLMITWGDIRLLHTMHKRFRCTQEMILLGFVPKCTLRVALAPENHHFEVPGAYILRSLEQLQKLRISHDNYTTSLFKLVLLQINTPLNML